MTEDTARAEAFEQLRQAREEALHHAREAQRMAAVRRELMRSLIAEGVSQSEIAHELGVTRQAIQKMLAI